VRGPLEKAAERNTISQVNEVEQAEREITEAGASGERFDQELQRMRERSRISDRSFIVKCVVSLYVLSVGGVILFLTIRGANSSEVVFPGISELIKIAIIPIVTLVIGYYFGTAREGQ